MVVVRERVLLTDTGSLPRQTVSITERIWAVLERNRATLERISRETERILGSIERMSNYLENHASIKPDFKLITRLEHQRSSKKLIKKTANWRFF